MIRARFAALGSLLRTMLLRAHRLELGLRASALAFSTLLSLVPLLAVISAFVARALREDDRRIFDLLTALLPYREETIVAALRGFLAQAESVSGLAVLGFLFTTILTFLGVQSTLFTIFGVEKAPSLVRRLVTFTMLFFWGPLLIGSAQAGLVVLSQSTPDLARLARESVALRIVPFVVTFIGLTMLYWRAAYRRVPLRPAAIGAVTAAIALELLKLSFTVYITEFTRVQRAVYGTLAITLFFVLSIQITWWILLLGAVLAATLAERKNAGPIELPSTDPWIGLATVERLGAPGRPTAALVELASELGLKADTLHHHLEPLLGAGLLDPAAMGDGHVRLAVPTRRLRLAMILAAYRNAAPGDDEVSLPPRAAELRERLLRASERELGETTLEELLDEPPDSDPGDSGGDAPPAAGVGPRELPASEPDVEDTIPTVEARSAREPRESSVRLDRPERGG